MFIENIKALIKGIARRDYIQEQDERYLRNDLTDEEIEHAWRNAALKVYGGQL